MALVTSATLVVAGALQVVTMFAIRNKCLTSSNKKNLIVFTSNLLGPFCARVGGEEGILALVTSATLVVTGALLVVTMFAIRIKCLTSSNNKNLIVITCKEIY